MFYQTNKFESTTGGKYHFLKILSRGSLFEKGVCISIDINFTFPWKNTTFWWEKQVLLKNEHGRSKNIQV